MIEALAQRYGLGERAICQLEQLVECVATDPTAPTSVTDRPGIVRDHLADSLVALELPDVRTARPRGGDGLRAATALADLGAGAGFPGLPLAVALPQTSVSLIESTRRKCEFIARAVQACGLENATVVHARAEAWPDGLGRFDLVTARALASLPVVAEYAAPLLRLGGTAVVWRGHTDPGEQAAAGAAASELGLELQNPRRVEPYPGAANRHLQLLVKVAPTPARFPRRPGMARKRPLGDAGPGHGAPRGA